MGGDGNYGYYGADGSLVPFKSKSIESLRVIHSISCLGEDYQSSNSFVSSEDRMVATGIRGHGATTCNMYGKNDTKYTGVLLIEVILIGLDLILLIVVVH